MQKRGTLDCLSFGKFLSIENIPWFPSCRWSRFNRLWDCICDRLERTSSSYYYAKYRARHSLNVAELVDTFAKEQGWPRWKRDTAVVAALLHDCEKFRHPKWHEVAAAQYIERKSEKLESLLPNKCSVEFAIVAEAVCLHAGEWRPQLAAMLQEDDIDGFDGAGILRIADKLAHPGREYKAYDAVEDTMSVLRKVCRRYALLLYFYETALYDFVEVHTDRIAQ